MSISGGRIAARGYQYQYFRTLEALIHHVDDVRVLAVRVEGPPDAQKIEKVDFDLIGQGDAILKAAQVKSFGPDVVVGGSELFGILADLVVDHRAESYELIVNALPSDGAGRLRELLEAGLGVAELKAGLSQTLKGAPRRRAQLEAMTDEQLRRLGLARLIVDARDEEEIRASLRRELRACRNSRKMGLGDVSSGLLLGYLISEVLRRAVDDGRAEFSRDELLSHLLIDGDVLARAAGIRDWGAVVGTIAPIPDVARPKLLSAVLAALPDGGEEDGLRTVVLVGLSGIGKSSLAAAFVGERADSYSLIAWSDGSSEAALLDSFRRALIAIRGDDRVGSQQDKDSIREGLHTELSRHVGRWAMIIDNVSDPRWLAPWIPTYGRGDVLITCTDSAANYGTAKVINIPVMEQEESTELLARRFGLVGEEQRARWTTHMNRLASSLDNWPLALEIGAGYMNSCGMTLEELDLYLSQLKSRSMADSDALPIGYPRTLAAAIYLAVDRLRAEHESAGFSDAAFAYRLVCVASCVGQRMIPMHLIGAAALLTESEAAEALTETSAGPIILDPRNRLLEAVRELRHYSLVDYDADLPAPARGERIANDTRTVTLNSIVQDLIREQVNVRGLLPDVAYHLQRWLSTANVLGEYARINLLFTHGLVLINHAVQARVVSSSIALLLGNLAGVSRARGDDLTADEMLSVELDLLDAARGDGGDTDFIICQTRIMRFALFVQAPTSSALTVEEALSSMEDVFMYCRSIALSVPDAAAKLGADSLLMLTEPSQVIEGDQRFARLCTAFEDLLGRLGPSVYAEAVQNARLASQALQDGDPVTAEALCLEALSADAVEGAAEIQIERLLLEAFAAQAKWTEARSVLDRLNHQLGDTSLHPSAMLLLAHNLGLVCAVSFLTSGDHGSTDLLRSILNSRALKSALQLFPPARLLLLRVVLEMADNQISRAKATLSIITDEDLDNGDGTEEGWRALRDIIRRYFLAGS